MTSVLKRTKIESLLPRVASCFRVLNIASECGRLLLYTLYKPFTPGSNFKASLRLPSMSSCCRVQEVCFRMRKVAVVHFSHSEATVRTRKPLSTIIEAIDYGTIASECRKFASECGNLLLCTLWQLFNLGSNFSHSEAIFHTRKP